jgi:hypothetical protein
MFARPKHHDIFTNTKATYPPLGLFDKVNGEIGERQVNVVHNAEMFVAIGIAIAGMVLVVTWWTGKQ